MCGLHAAGRGAPGHPGGRRCRVLAHHRRAIRLHLWRRALLAGFGRTGEWFSVDHWKVEPDLITIAKGLTSAYVQLGAVGMRRQIADHFAKNVFYGGLTYNSHPLACAAALATIAVYEEDNLIERAREMGVVMRGLLEDLKARHPSVGATRNLGLFGIVELVRNRETLEPLAPFNGTSPEMQALGKYFRQEGLYTFVRWNTFFCRHCSPRSNWKHSILLFISKNFPLFTFMVNSESC